MIYIVNHLASTMNRDKKDKKLVLKSMFEGTRKKWCKFLIQYTCYVNKYVGGTVPYEREDMLEISSYKRESG